MKNFSKISIAILAVFFLLSFNISVAASGNLTEDFSTNTYKDATATTANWDTVAHTLSGSGGGGNPDVYNEATITHVPLSTGVAQRWNGDDSAWVYNLPFTFNFYGTDYNDLSVSSNGVICLNSAVDCTWYANSVSSSTDGPIISPLGRDLLTNNRQIGRAHV